MLASNKLTKIGKEMSNFIVGQVLERSDVLIKNSYRRLTTENETRNEHWAQIAEMVNAHFDTPTDVEKIKSHFHNRKKVLLCRLKEALRHVQHSSIDEKMEEILKRNLLQTEIDLKFARICLEVDDEDRIRIDGDKADDISSMWSQLFEQASSLPSSSLTNEAPLLSKMLSEQIEQPSGSKRPAEKVSHLIVDVTSTTELKRLLCVLIDHGFYRFQHVDNHRNYIEDVPKDVVRELQSRQTETIKVDVKVEEDDCESYESSSRKISESQNRKRTCSEESIDDENQHEFLDEDEDVKSKSLALFQAMTEEVVVTPATKRPRTSANNSTIINAQCTMCDSVIRLNTGGSKWNLFEHVVLKHSTYRPYKCTVCNYEATRKIRVRQHALSQHNSEIEPLDMSTPDVRKEWMKIMSECFPQHQYGRNTIASRCQ